MPHTLQTHLVFSAALGREQPVSFFIPNEIEHPGAWDTLFLLHGMGGDHIRWAQNCDLESVVSGNPVLLVMPSCENSFYLDSPIGNFESFIIHDLIEHIEKNYPVKKVNSSRGLTGYSMGGYGALLLALRNPNIFGSAASHSGAVLTARATHEAGVKWDLADTLYGVGAEGRIKRNAHDIALLASGLIETKTAQGHRQYVGPSLYLDCGTEDFLYYASRELTQTLRMLQIPYQYHELSGEHNWEYWSLAARNSFRFHFDFWSDHS